MNYSKIGWTEKTAITKSDLTHMDEGIYELAAESSETKSRVEQLRFSNIQAGVYFFGSDTTAEEENRNGVLQKKITFPAKFKQTPYVFAVANTGKPDVINVSIANVDASSFVLFLKYDPSAKPGNTINGNIIKVSVNWLALGN